MLLYQAAHDVARRFVEGVLHVGEIGPGADQAIAQLWVFEGLANQYRAARQFF